MLMLHRADPTDFSGELRFPHAPGEDGDRVLSRLDRGARIRVPVGRLSGSARELRENVLSALEQIHAAKPVALRGGRLVRTTLLCPGTLPLLLDDDGLPALLDPGGTSDAAILPDYRRRVGARRVRLHFRVPLQGNGGRIVNRGFFSGKSLAIGIAST